MRRRFRSMRVWRLAAAGLVALAFPIAATASAAGGVYDGDCLPPPGSELRAASPLRFETAAGPVELSNLVLSSFATPCERLPKAGGTDTKTYDALLVAGVSVGGGASDDATTTAKLTQSVTATSKGGKARTFEVELPELTPVTLGPAVRLRESPTLASRGQFTVGKAPRGAADVVGSLDLWTEASVDGGLTWVPAVDVVGNPAPTRLELEPEQ